jgi:energy-coupling factor transporter transmembrane protein EcfT
VNTPGSLEGKEEYKLEYIKGMISIVREDMKMVMLYITLAFAIILLFLSQIPLKTLLSLPLWSRVLAFAGIIFQASAALFFFLYIRKLHITQMKMTRCIVSLDAIRARELWAGEAGVWQQHKVKYQVGQYALSCGTAFLAIVLFRILVL